MTEKIKIQCTESGYADTVYGDMDKLQMFPIGGWVAHAEALDPNDDEDYKIVWSTYKKLDKDFYKEAGYNIEALEGDADVEQFCIDNELDNTDYIDWEIYDVYRDGKNVTEKVEVIRNQYFA